MPKTVVNCRDRLAVGSSPTPREPDQELPRFQRLLSDLSTAFVQAGTDSIDLEIERSLERVVLMLGLDRSTLYQVGPNGIAHISHQWARPGLPRTPKYTNVLKIAPWVTGRVMSGQTVEFSSLDDLPPEAAQNRVAYRTGSNKSNVTVPVKFGKKVVGAARPIATKGGVVGHAPIAAVLGGSSIPK